MTARRPLAVPVLVAVAAGGAVGAVLRHALGNAFPDVSGRFPWTILAVNVAGCALLALLPASAAVRRHDLLPPFLGPGVLGGFTTLSTYGDQARALAAGGHEALAGTYVVGTLAACLLAVLAAGRLASAVAGSRHPRGPE